MPYRPIYRDFDVVPAYSAPAWRRRGVSFAEARGLEQRHQAALPARLALPLVLGAPAPMEAAATTPSFRRAFLYDRNRCSLTFYVLHKVYAKETGQEAQSWPSPYGP
jgi:hypothetical protein